MGAPQSRDEAAEKDVARRLLGEPPAPADMATQAITEAFSDRNTVKGVEAALNRTDYVTTAVALEGLLKKFANNTDEYRVIDDAARALRHVPDVFRGYQKRMAETELRQERAVRELDRLSRKLSALHSIMEI